MKLFCCPGCKTDTDITVYKRRKVLFRWKVQCMKCNPEGKNWYYAVGITRKDAICSWNFFSLET